MPAERRAPLGRIAYVGYDLLYPCLPALEQAGCEVVELFTFDADERFESTRRVRAFAAARGIPCGTRPVTMTDLARLRAAGCRALVCGGYTRRLPVDPALPGVNIHPALLPVGRGPWPMPAALLRGDRRGGVTLHKISPELDGGDILLQQEFPLRADEDLETMTAKIRTAAAALCTRLAADFDALWAVAAPQGAGEYWPEPGREAATVTAQTPPEQTERILRAFYGFDCWLRLPDGSERCLVRGRFLPQPAAGPFGSRSAGADGTVRWAVNGGVIVTPPEGSV